MKPTTILKRITESMTTLHSIEDSFPFIEREKRIREVIGSLKEQEYAIEEEGYPDLISKLNKSLIEAKRTLSSLYSGEERRNAPFLSEKNREMAKALLCAFKAERVYVFYISPSLFLYKICLFRDNANFLHEQEDTLIRHLKNNSYETSDKMRFSEVSELLEHIRSM